MRIRLRWSHRLGSSPREIVREAHSETRDAGIPWREARELKQIGPDIGGQSLESVRAQFLRDFGSLFNSEQELHTHDEAHELMEPLPTPNIVLVE